MTPYSQSDSPNQRPSIHPFSLLRSFHRSVFVESPGGKASQGIEQVGEVPGGWLGHLGGGDALPSGLETQAWRHQPPGRGNLGGRLSIEVGARPGACRARSHREQCPWVGRAVTDSSRCCLRSTGGVCGTRHALMGVTFMTSSNPPHRQEVGTCYNLRVKDETTDAERGTENPSKVTNNDSWARLLSGWL